MKFVLIGLGVFMVMRIILLVDALAAPKWFWSVMSVGLAAAGLAIAGENALWCPAVAGISLGFYRLDTLLTALRDWARVQVVRPRHR